MSMVRRASLVALAGASFASGSMLTGCKQQTPSPPAVPDAAIAVAPAPPPPPPEPRAAPECAAALTAAPVEALQVAGRQAQRSGTTLTFSEKDADGQLVLGTLGPINEDSGKNLVALRKYLKFFKDEKADAIVVTGDVGELSESIGRSLAELGKSGLPVFVIAGNRECSDVFVDGVELARKQAPNIISMHSTRVVAFPEATLISLPGYHDPNFITCANGCRYFKSTVDEVIQAAKEAKSPAVLVAHGPPRGEGSQALDYASSAGNVGDPEVNRAVAEGNISFGLFGNIKEAGARATDVAGTTLVPQDTLAKSIFMAPGPADTTHWVMNDKTQSQGFAATFTLKEGQGRWKLFRNKPPTAAEKAEAKKLNPAPAPRPDAGVPPDAGKVPSP